MHFEKITLQRKHGKEEEAGKTRIHKMNKQAKIVNILTLVENILPKKTTSGHLKWLKSNFTD